MTRDRDISLGKIDSVPVDDAPRRPQPPSAARPAGREGAPPGRTAPPGPGRPGRRRPAGGGQGPWVIATVLLGICLLLGGAWLWRELAGMRAQLDASLQASQQKLGNLESQLSATDESLSQSSGKVRETLQLHDSEIRKLWDVSNKRNRDWIQENQAAIRKLDAQRTELGKLVAGLQTQLATLRQQQEAAGVQRNQQQTQLDLVAETVKQLERRIAGQREALARLEALLPQVEQLAALQRQGAGLGKRMEEIEAAIAAFDAYRRQVNNRLDRIETGAAGGN